MDLSSRVTHQTSSGREVRPGLREPVLDPTLERLTLSVSTVCDALSPQAWHGEVALAGHVLLTTGSVPTQLEAERLVRDAWTTHLVKLLKA